MAAAHGFRIYFVSAYQNQKKGHEQLDVSSSSSTRDEILRLLEAASSRGTIQLRPRVLPEADEGLEAPKIPVKTISVGTTQVVSQSIAHVIVAVGETGSHARATKENETALDIHDRAPEADHFVTLIFPQTIGHQFVLVTQTVRRRDPVSRLFRVLTEQGSIAKKERAEERSRAVAAVRESGQPLPKQVQNNRLLFEYRQAADDAYLDEIIGAAQSATATFTSTRASTRGGPRQEVERSLSIQLRDERKREISTVVGRSWASQNRSGKKTTAHEGVSQLGKTLQEQDLLHGDEYEQYDHAKIAIRNKSGDSTTIAVDTMRDVFTYPISDGGPSVEYFYRKISTRVAKVASQAQIDLPRVDPSEVMECLDV